MRRRNCNLELRLVSVSDPDHMNHEDQPIAENGNNGSESPEQRQQLTIFYNGRVCVSDVTELQARTIIFLASREMEDKLRTPTGTPAGSEIASPALPPRSPLYSPSTGLCMKRSIQQFLQKRRHRVQANSPYNH